VVEVPFAITTPAGRIEAKLLTVEDEVPVFAVVHSALGLDDVLIELASRVSEKEGRPVTCAKGCDACCYHLVPLTPAEAFALLARVEALAPDDREHVEMRFAAARTRIEEVGLLGEVEGALRDAEVTSMRAYHRARIPCPFLDVDARVCTAYAHRPVACREHLVISPPVICDDPGPSMARLPLLVRMEGALRAVVRPVWPWAPAKVPLPLALDWARAHREHMGVQRPGVELVEALLAGVG